MQKTLFIVFCWAIIQSISGQKKIDSTAIRADIDILEKIIKKGHPSLYEYISQDSLDYLIETVKESINNDFTDITLYKDILTITNQIRDGHLVFAAPSTIKTDQYYFPLILKIINTEFYTDTNDFDIPIGSQIKKINTVDVSNILERFKKYAPTDGYNLTKKYRDIELKFGQFYTYEFGITKKFEVEYIQPDGIEKIIILDAEPFVKVKLRNTKRNSYFAKYHNQENGFDFFDKFIGNKTPFVYYKEYLGTAILTVNSFGGDIRIFQSHLTKIFKEINKRKIRHLIVDIRQNDGGFRANAVHLFSFLTQKNFKQTTSSYVTALSIPEKKHLSRSFLNEKEFLNDKFKNHPVYDGWKLPFDDMETIMVPDENRFNGKVYVLTGGTSFSAAATFALNVKNDPDMILIGEETGGGYYFHNGEFPVYYELPNSKIKFAMFMEKVNHYTKNKNVPKGSGVPPDKYITISREDLISGKDVLLDYVYKLIKGR
ncbi:S41 family peptidase [Aquimarina sp. AU474]|uniref:S41 family peptidase n=1 Tax=Aquimarina sp. AU474 TaxID=2108529 RepID=UPI000D68FD8F|nr:S41 family peptidase [Aquimarina sp. AU474]